MLLTVLTRLPALVYPHPIDDEAIYSVVATEIVHGGRPYVNAVERKPPLLFWTYAALFDLAGPYDWRALHVLAVLWVLATMAGLFVAGREIAGPEAGLAAALLYSIFQPWMTWKNLALNGELLMNLPLAWALAILFARERPRSRPGLLAAGALIAVACLLKQPAGIAILPAVVYMLTRAYRGSRGLGVSDARRHAALVCVGFAAALVTVGLVLRAQGILGDAWYWSVGDHDMPHVFWLRAVEHSTGFLLACLPLVGGAIVSLRNGDLWRGRAAERDSLIVWIAASCIGVSASARFYPHYYIQLVLPLAVAAAPAYARLWQQAAPRWSLAGTATAAWLIATMLVFAVSQSVGLRAQRTPPAGLYLRQHSSSADRVFVWGQSPRIYDDAERRPACRYVATFPLTGYVFGSTVPGLDLRSRILPGAWSTLQQDFARHRPAFIVDTEAGPGALTPIAQFPVLQQFIARDYQPVWRSAAAVVYRRRALSGAGG